eukprot:gene10617-12291_t
MPVSQEKLRDILERENAKKGPMGYRAPAQLRELALDTHKAAPTADYGPSPDLINSMAAQRANERAYRASMQPPVTKCQSEPQSPCSTLRNSLNSEFRSVFKPSPGQEYHCNLAKTRRENIKKSEWALVETLEVQLFNNDRDRRKQEYAASQQSFRKTLDSQMRAHEADARAEAEVKKHEAAALLLDIAKFKEEEKAKLEAAKDRNMRLNAETLNMVHAARVAKTQALKSKKEDEAGFLRECEVKLAEERAMKEAKAEARRVQQEQTTRENVEKLRLKAEAAKLEKENDVAYAKAAIERADKLDLERAAAVRAVQEAAIAKSNRAMAHPGMKKQAERLALEKEWLQRAAELKEVEALEKDALQKAKREKMKVDLKQAHEEFLERREREADQAKAEMSEIRKTMTIAEFADREAQINRVHSLRDKNTQNAMFLSMQMKAKEEKSLVDDIGMSERERQLNLKLLNHAVEHVGPKPMQLTADFS